MNKDKITEAMGYIDPAFIEEADIQAGKPKRRWKRPALIAACLCLVLAGTALASEIAGVHISEFFEETLTDWNGEERDAISYEFKLTGIQRIPTDTLSPKVSEHIEKTRGGDGYHIALSVGSMERAEEFLGVDLPDNPVLDQAKHGWKHFYRGDQLSGNASYANGFCAIYLIGTNKNPTQISLDLAYEFPGAEDDSMAVEVSMSLFTDECDRSIEEDGLEFGVTRWQAAGHALNALDSLGRFTYTTPSGLEATILETSDRYTFLREEVTIYYYRAYFMLDGIFFKITAHTSDEALALETLEQVLDGFAYEAPVQP